MFFDCHIHTEFSSDSQLKASDAIKAAQDLGLGLVFTEHFDLDYQKYLGGDLDFAFSPEKYWESYKDYRAGASVLLGVECGLIKNGAGGVKAFLSRAPFDMVIGSLHLLDGGDIYDPAYCAGKKKDDVYARYFEAMAELIYEHSFIDTLGHIDYICRVATYEDAGLNYRRYEKFIDAVLTALLETDTAFEINTRRFGERAAIDDLLPVYRRYQTLGGRFVTIGSDAHRAAAIGAYYADAARFAKDLALTPVAFKERKAILMK